MHTYPLPCLMGGERYLRCGGHHNCSGAVLVILTSRYTTVQRIPKTKYVWLSRWQQSKAKQSKGEVSTPSLASFGNTQQSQHGFNASNGPP